MRVMLIEEWRMRMISGGFSVLAVAGLAALALAQTERPRLVVLPHPVTSPDINAADLSARDKILSDDIFQGRGPGTRSGEAAAQWIADEMKRIGLKPGNHGSYFQNVPAVVIALNAAQSSLTLNTQKGVIPTKFPDSITYWTPR